MHEIIVAQLVDGNFKHVLTVSAKSEEYQGSSLNLPMGEFVILVRTSKKDPRI